MIGQPSPPARSRHRRLWLLTPLLAVSYLATAPGGEVVPHDPDTPVRVRPEGTRVVDPSVAARVAELIKPSRSALYDPNEHRVPVAPRRITIAGIGVEEAPVVGVGVAPTGEMEIPGATEVGWYQYGVSPGDAGAAVMAAHIAFEGQRGVFRHLASVGVGDEILVEMADGRRLGFVVTETAQFSKTDLPFERIFAKEGQSVLVLITCGGDFNRELREYSDNLVAFAVPAA